MQNKNGIVPNINDSKRDILMILLKSLGVHPYQQLGCENKQKQGEVKKYFKNLPKLANIP